MEGAGQAYHRLPVGTDPFEAGRRPGRTPRPPLPPNVPRRDCRGLLAPPKTLLHFLQRAPHDRLHGKDRRFHHCPYPVENVSLGHRPGDYGYAARRERDLGMRDLRRLAEPAVDALVHTHRARGNHLGPAPVELLKNQLSALVQEGIHGGVRFVTGVAYTEHVPGHGEPPVWSRTSGTYLQYDEPAKAGGPSLRTSSWLPAPLPAPAPAPEYSRAARKESRPRPRLVLPSAAGQGHRLRAPSTERLTWCAPCDARPSYAIAHDRLGPATASFQC